MKRSVIPGAEILEDVHTLTLLCNLSSDSGRGHHFVYFCYVHRYIENKQSCYSSYWYICCTIIFMAKFMIMHIYAQYISHLHFIHFGAILHESPQDNTPLLV